MPNEMDILVFGSAIVDLICYVDRLPRPGETLHGTKFSTGFGGKGANQCVAAARLGARTALIAKLGDDSWGHNYLRHLRDEGVDVTQVEKCPEESTGIAQICVSTANGENHIVIVVGANNHMQESDVSKSKQLFEKAKILICQLETPLKATLTALRQFSGVSILNAAPALKDTPKELIGACDIFCVNESEAALMIGSEAIHTLTQAQEALRQLLQMGGNTIIITLGPVGAVYVRKEEPCKYIHVPAPSVSKVLDTTGAGDAFIGSLAFYLARYPQLPLHQQIGAACEVASYSVQHTGTQSSFPKASQIQLDLSTRAFKWHEL